MQALLSGRHFIFPPRPSTDWPHTNTSWTPYHRSHIPVNNCTFISTLTVIIHSDLVIELIKPRTCCTDISYIWSPSWSNTTAAPLPAPHQRTENIIASHKRLSTRPAAFYHSFVSAARRGAAIENALQDCNEWAGIQIRYSIMIRQLQYCTNTNSVGQTRVSMNKKIASTQNLECELKVAFVF